MDALSAQENLSEARPELHAYSPRGTANSVAPRTAIASSYEHSALSWQITSNDGSNNAGGSIPMSKPGSIFVSAKG